MLDEPTYLKHLRRLASLNGIEAPELRLPAQQDVVANGHRLHYHDWGNGSADPILFLHGGGLTAHTWDSVCLTMRSQFHCLALDFRGHGDSEWSDEYDLHGHVSDVRSIVQSLSLDNLTIVGMSMGGFVAVSYAEQFSDLSALVVIDVGPKVARKGAAKRIRSFIDGAELDSIDEFVNRSLDFNSKRDPSLLRVSLLHNLRRLPNGKLTWKYDPRHYQLSPGQAPLFDTTKIWDNVATIRCPTLIVRGSESEILSRTAGRKLAASFPDGQFAEIPGAGHTVQGDNAPALAECLKEFLARYRRSD